MSWERKLAVVFMLAALLLAASTCVGAALAMPVREWTGPTPVSTRSQREALCPGAQWSASSRATGQWVNSCGSSAIVHPRRYRQLERTSMRPLTKQLTRPDSGL